MAIGVEKPFSLTSSLESNFNVNMSSSQETIEDDSLYQDIIGVCNRKDEKSLEGAAQNEEPGTDQEAKPQTASLTRAFPENNDALFNNETLIGAIERLAGAVLVLSGKHDLILEKVEKLESMIDMLSHQVVSKLADREPSESDAEVTKEVRCRKCRSETPDSIAGANKRARHV
ncbi:hypothetical protein EJ05DRAFT_270457 [Pseudovirgaria hyperparasitica]|uniref:Uncharacterized protein n=1 Tax=Pseudovirgaria hyperparasitica TaxID=470096 RepID=A0A6A6VPS4_9PEZI|nr:uncharacterized protein EJ05DRAFT_270457 [Pseudovirgaria hyperparasitica]KAF2752622.1 hypothetical protein EJ05DRAFT_270457 [Pseudovirgaria hyperparasitica]